MRAPVAVHPLPKARIIHERHERRAHLRAFHTVFTECFSLGILELLGHRVRREKFENLSVVSMRNLCDLCEKLLAFVSALEIHI
jgi:hypothetical protein